MITFSETLPTAERWEVSRRINSALCPAHWSSVPLHLIATVQNGFPFESRFFNATQGIPLIRIRDVGATDTDTYYSGPYDEEFLVQRGDILIGMDGEFRCRRWAGRPGLLNQRVCRVRVTSSDVDEQFVFTLLQTYVSAVEAVTSSITVKHLSSKTVENLEIALPPLGERRRIVAKLDELLARSHAARAALDAVPSLIEQLQHMLLTAAVTGELSRSWRCSRSEWDEQSATAHTPRAVGGMPAIPGSWRYLTVADIAQSGTVVTYGIVLPGPEIPDGVPYVRQQDIEEGRVKTEQLARTTREIAAKHDRSALQQGDVLLCIIRHLRVAVVPAGIDGANVTQGTVRIRPAPFIAPEYLATFLSAPPAQEWMKRCYIGMAMPRINVKDARAVPVAVPPIEEQREIMRRLVEDLEVLDRMSAASHEMNEMLGQLEQAMLVEAFSGGLVPQDPSDEPASDLLARLRAEHASAPAPRTRRRTTSRT